MHGPPTLETERLRLRAFELADAREVERLAGDRAVAATTLRIPHPYPPGAAVEWIGRHARAFAEDEAVSFAVVRRADDALLGAIGLVLDLPHEHAEIGYWIGRPYWGHGYCTEAAGAVVRYAFETRGLHRVYAHIMKGNPASGRVLEKIGMTREGEFPEHIRKDGRFVDLVHYGMLRRDSSGRREAAR